MMYKIKVGDVLKTRDGCDIRIICIDAKGDYSVIGLEFVDGAEYTRYFKSCGTSSISNRKEDLILPTPKTKRVAPALCKVMEGEWCLAMFNSRGTDRPIWIEKKECSPNCIWLEHLAVDVPDDGGI